MDEAADALTICRARCGDEVADQLLPVELLVAVMDVVAELQERIDGLDAACATRRQASVVELDPLHAAEPGSPRSPAKRALTARRGATGNAHDASATYADSQSAKARIDSRGAPGTEFSCLHSSHAAFARGRAACERSLAARDQARWLSRHPARRRRQRSSLHSEPE